MEKLWGGDKSIRAAHFWERGLTLPSLPHGEIEARPQGNPHQFPPPLHTRGALISPHSGPFWGQFGLFAVLGQRVAAASPLREQY